MVKDFKAKPAGGGAAARKKAAVSCWTWLFVGILLGGSGVGVLWMRDNEQRLFGPPLEQNAAAETGAKTTGPAVSPRFDFYSILPEMEVVVPESELPASVAPQPSRPVEPVTATTEGVPATAAAPAPAPVQAAIEAPAGGVWLLQVGSFRRLADAERLKASLALQGIEAGIQKVTVNGTEDYHRVRVGPFSDTNQVQSTRARLQAQNIDSILIKLKK